MSERTPLAQALKHAEERLTAAGVDTPRLDAKILLAHILGVPWQSLGAKAQVTLDAQTQQSFAALIKRRQARQPVSQIIESRGFWTLDLKVTPDTLDPRPDSECLIEAVLDHFKDRTAPLSIVDFGTGTGCLVLALLSEYPQATGIGVDISPQALMVAEENARSCGLAERVRFVESRWGEKITGQSFDVILSNPPYIPDHDITNLAPEVKQWEPRLALSGGDDGLECYRTLMPDIKRLLAPGGVAVLEIGQGQQDDVRSISHTYDLTVMLEKCDLNRVIRCIMLFNKASEQGV